MSNEITREGLENFLINLPINENIIEGKVGTYGVIKLKSGKGFVKRITDLLNSIAMGIDILSLDYGNHQDKIDSAEGYFKYVEIAKIFQKIVEEGFYHPKTQFMVCEDKEGNPTIMAITPKLEPLYDEDPFHTQQKIEEKKEKIKEKFGLKELSGDTGWPFNYGLSPEGELYYFDLHLLGVKN